MYMNTNIAKITIQAAITADSNNGRTVLSDAVNKQDKYMSITESNAPTPTPIMISKTSSSFTNDTYT